jgi:hypothetical protein
MGFVDANVRHKIEKQKEGPEVADDDSQFSYVTEEPGLLPEENILDLAIDQADYFGENLRAEVDLADFTAKSF